MLSLRLNIRDYRKMNLKVTVIITIQNTFYIKTSQVSSGSAFYSSRDEFFIFYTKYVEMEN